MNYIYTRSQPFCPWCDRVKNLLNAYKIPFEERDITNPEYMEEFISLGYRTVPQVFINNKYVGGFENTAEYLRG